MKTCSRRQFLGILGASFLASSCRQLTEGDSPFVWSPDYSFAWAKRFPYSLITENHIFPVDKYDRLQTEILSDLVQEEELVCPLALTEEDFRLVHTKKYLSRLEGLAHSVGGLFNGENPLTSGILDFAKASCAGTYYAAEIALQKGRGMNLSGGFHHAFPHQEEGFCYLNDVAIAIKKLQKEKKIKKAMIVDCDVHHGNGNAFIFSGEPSVFIFDIYQSDNYPEKKFDVNMAIALDSQEFIDDAKYLKELTAALKPAVESFKPNIIFYLDGADPYKKDLLGGFKMTHAGLKERDAHVVKVAGDLGIPLAVVLAGGYSPNLEDVVKVHYNCAKMIQRS